MLQQAEYVSILDLRCQEIPGSTCLTSSGYLTPHICTRDDKLGQTGSFFAAVRARTRTCNTTARLNDPERHCHSQQMASFYHIIILLSYFLVLSHQAATPTGLQACLSNAGVSAVMPSSSSFTQLSQPYNLRLIYVPAAIILPITPQQVSQAVLCAKGYGKIQARSGGHS